MRVEEYIFNSLKKYPTLYASPSYERSKLEILHHAFIVLGNGLDWAVTSKPEDGGYITEPQYYKTKLDEDGYPLRKPDKPYHKSGIVIDEAYLEQCRTMQIYTSLRFGRKKIWKNEDDEVNGLVKLGIDKDWSPYPNFQKEFSCFWPNQFNNNDLTYLKDDWREAAIEHLEICKKWHESYDNLVEDAKNYVSHYYTAESIERAIKENEGKKGFLQKANYDKYNWGGDYAVLAEALNLETSGSAINFCEETINKLKGV